MKQDSIVLNSNLTPPKTIIEVPIKKYSDIKFKDPSIIENTDHVDFNDKYLDNNRWIRVNEMPTWNNELTPKLYVENATKDIVSYIDILHEINRNKRDLSSVFIDQDIEFDNKKLTN